MLMAYGIHFNEVEILVNSMCFRMRFHTWSIKWLSELTNIWIVKFNGKFERGSNSCEMCQNQPFILASMRLHGEINQLIKALSGTFYLEIKHETSCLD